MLVLSTLLGCEHATPFAAGSYGSDQPFGGGSPHRLTYNAGQDRAPAWLADESGVIYSFQRTDRPDHDWCLGVLPPDGGQLVREICDRSPGADDSTDVLTEPAPDAQGRVAYVMSRSPVGAITPSSIGLVLATLANPISEQAMVTFPYHAADTAPHQRAVQVRWLGTSTLIYVAERLGIEGHCPGCPLDTVWTGVAIDRLDLSQSPPTVSVLPGTWFASSVAVGATPDVIFYTLGGDSHVYRRTLSTGTDSVVFDFGTAGIARDARIAGSQLVAVVGGTVTNGFDSTLGYQVQRDSGGPIHVVDLETGADIVLTSDLAFRHPALSPSGKRLVVEAYANGTSDLWEFDLP